MRALFTTPVAAPLASIVAFQSILTMGAYAIPVVIPVAAADLDIAPESVGGFVALVYLTAMIVGLGAGGLIARLGPTRLFQLLLVLVGAGAAALALGSVPAAVLGAILIGAASGPMNPAGSHVLVRVAPVDIRALVFSLKQTGTPLGGMLAGTVLPPLMVAFDWRMSLLAITTLAGLLLVLAPLGRLGGPAAVSTGGGGQIRAAFAAMRTIVRDPALRAVTLAGFGLAVCQMGLATYLVVYLLTTAGYSAAEAGLVFAVLHVSGIVSRIILGVLADRVLTTRNVLVLIGFVLSVALVGIAFLSSAWPIALVYAMMVLAGSSGNGWVGLYFAELARLSPPERVAEVASGSQFMTYLGIVCGPLLFGALLEASGSYGVSFGALAGVALTCGVYLALSGR